MVEARAAEMTLEEASEIESVESENASTSSDETSTEESGEEEWNWSESVLAGVMQKNNITDREAFIEFAKSYDMDGNQYLKGSELGAAAADFAAKDQPAEESPAEEETPDEEESTEESSEDDEKEPEVVWRNSGDSQDDQ